MYVDNGTIARNVRKIVADKTIPPVNNTDKIAAIREVRERYGFGLLLSKNLVEAATSPPEDPIIKVLDDEQSRSDILAFNDREER